MDQTIVHVLTTIDHGGAERVVLDLARQQRVLGARAEVICLHRLGALLSSFESAGVPATLLGGSDRPGALRTGWHLAAALRACHPAVVHTHNAAPQITTGLGQRLRHWRRPGTVLIHTEHGRLSDVRPTRIQLRRWTAAEFDAVVAVSADARVHLLSHGIRGTTGVDVIANGVDLTRFVPRVADPGAPLARLVHVGRLDRIKGQDLLLDAFALVQREYPAARLTIVGDGPDREQLEQRARTLRIHDAVDFVGAVIDVRPYLGAADLFVLPSRSEGTSIALLEAMATALPCVATDVGGNREVLASESCGTLVAPERADLLAAAILATLRDPGRAAAQGAAGRCEVERRFAFDQTAAAYMRCYDRARVARTARTLGRAA